MDSYGPFEPIEKLDAGHAGTYGSRAGNLMLQSCDVLITLGTRLAIPQKGYVDDELARNADIFVIECDQIELISSAIVLKENTKLMRKALSSYMKALEIRSK